MKTLRLLGMALIAILVSANFIACSSDDDEEITKNDDGIITNQKKLMEMKEIYKDGTNTYSFSYDSKGRLISVTEKDFDSNSSKITNITWGNNTITSTLDGESITYTLTDGLVRTIRESDDSQKNISFAYNSSKELTTIQYSDKYGSYSDTYTWENGKITELTDGEDCTIYMTYNGKTCKGYFPLFTPDDDGVIFYGHPELAGMRVTQLPEQSYSKEGNDEVTTKMTYKLDKDGYLESCTDNSTETNVSSGTTYTSTTTYTFKWE